MQHTRACRCAHPLPFRQCGDPFFRGAHSTTVALNSARSPSLVIMAPLYSGDIVVVQVDVDHMVFADSPARKVKCAAPDCEMTGCHCKRKANSPLEPVVFKVVPYANVKKAYLALAEGDPRREFRKQRHASLKVGNKTLLQRRSAALGSLGVPVEDRGRKSCTASSMRMRQLGSCELATCCRTGSRQRRPCSLARSASERTRRQAPFGLLIRK
jgi:hypothetical protein